MALPHLWPIDRSCPEEVTVSIQSVYTGGTTGRNKTDCHGINESV